METEGGVSALLRPSRVGVRVVGAINWPPTGSDADPIEPRLDITACPHASTLMLGLPLYKVEFTFRILRPDYRETVTHQPFCEDSSINRT